MSIIATVTIPATEFPLGSSLDPKLDATLSVETTVPTSEGVIPYLWVPATDGGSIVKGLESESNVASMSVVDEMGGNVLLKVEWANQVNGLLESIQHSDAIVTNAVGTHERWTFRLRFPAYEDLSRFYTDCVDQDISLDLVQLHEAVSPESELRFGLTSAQRDLVIAAYEAGYFDVPRQTTLVELGEQLEVSDSAVSQRLRRGLATLIGSTLAVCPDAVDGDSLEDESVTAAETTAESDDAPEP
ncbi:helix-turn-helix domain-containing protein [Natrarchaeobius sp. A-rgal3]|uniref:helix-turn-helix domain-containing protein n=1 Tax=Natrarchaeobius versutus TaxID=1679078 RepID=UPI00350FE71E